jgi:hypothetical protein
LKWQDGAYDGARPVLDYKISYAEASSNTFTVFASNVIEQTEIITGLTPGVSYKFMVQSRNIVNFSLNSAEITIQAVQVADQPT